MKPFNNRAHYPFVILMQGDNNALFPFFLTFFQFVSRSYHLFLRPDYFFEQLIGFNPFVSSILQFPHALLDALPFLFYHQLL